MNEEQERHARGVAAVAVWRAEVEANESAVRKHMATWFGEASVLVAVFPTVDQLLKDKINYNIAGESITAAVLLLVISLWFTKVEVR